MECVPPNKRELDYDEEKEKIGSQEYKNKTIELGSFFDLSEVHEAARRGYSEEIQTAYERNKDSIKILDEKGNTPLHWASRFGNFETCGLLLQLGLDPKSVNEDGDTALHLAAKNNHPRICELLTCKGTDSMRNLRNKEGKTPMDLARNQDVRIALSELHRWPTHKELLIYVHGLSKHTNQDVRRQIVAKHMESIQMKEQLMLLTMKDCALDDNDIERLAQVIKTHKSLTTINLCNNQITDRGASFLLDAIRATSAPLKELHLTGNKKISTMQRIEIEIGLRSLALRLNNEPDPSTLPPLRILCLDGGGMKGLVLVKMLMKIEEKCGVQFSHLFDLVCGTSTGGLIALSQLKTPRKTLEDMLDLYLGLGRDVFRYHIGGKSPIMGTVHKLSGRGYYDTNLYEERVKDEFQDMDLYNPSHDPKVFVVSSQAQTHLHKYLFSSYEHKHSVLYPRAPMNTKIWQAGRATSAAPTFFDSIKFEEDVLIDGGLTANNPTEIALQEARYIWPNRKIGIVVSMGCGMSTNVSKSLGDRMTPKILKQLRDIVTDTHRIHETVSSQLVTMRQLGEDVAYYRLNPEFAKKYPLDVNSEEDLVNIQKDTEMFIKEMEETFVDLCARLKKLSNLSGRIDPDIDTSVSTSNDAPISKKPSQESMTTSKRKSRKLSMSKAQNVNSESPRGSTDSIRKSHRKSVSEKIIGLFEKDKPEEEMQLDTSASKTRPAPKMRKWVVKSEERSVYKSTENVVSKSSEGPVVERIVEVNKNETTVTVLLDSKGEPKIDPKNNNNYNYNKINISKQKLYQTYHPPKISRGDSLVKDRVTRFSDLTRTNSKEIYRKKSDRDKDCCVANVDVESVKEGDLSFKSGDVLIIIEKHPNGWWECELRGSRGWVSSKYVRELRSRSVTDAL